MPLVKMNTLSREDYDEIFSPTIIHTADDEEPDCMRCDHCCDDDKICEECGPSFWWANYKRTEVLE